MSKDTQLNIHARATGTDQAAADLKKVGDAQDAVAKETAGAKKPTDALNESQKKLNASTEDFTSLLSRVNPALGGLFDGMVKGSKIFGDMFEKEIDLNAITKKLSSTFAENAGLLKGLGAAGVAAIGFTVLAKSISFVVAESNRLREEMQKLREEQGEEDVAVRERAESTFRRSAGRKEGRLEASNFAEIERIIKQVMREGQVEDMDLFERNLAALFGKLSPKEIETLTVAGYEANLEGDSPQGLKLRGQAALRRRGTQEASKRRREQTDDQERLTEERAKDEAATNQAKVGQTNIEAVAERLGLTSDVKLLVRMVQKIARTDRVRAAAGASPLSLDQKLQNAQVSSRGGGTALAPWTFLADHFGKQDDKERIEAERLARAVGVLPPKNQAEEAEADRAAGSPNDQRASADPAAPITNNYITHTEVGTRNTGADAAAQKKRRVNGESELADVRAMTA